MAFDDSKIISTISCIHSLCAEYLRDELAKKGLPNLASSHGYILFLLSKEPGLSMQEVSKRINRDKSTTTVLVRKLIKLELVNCETSKEDCRIKSLHLTEKGKNYNQLTEEISKDLKTKFFLNFSESEVKQLETLLLKAKSNFKDENCKL